MKKPIAWLFLGFDRLRLRAAKRYDDPPSARNSYIGFGVGLQ